MRFDKIKEYVFLLMIGWCFGVAQITAWLGLSYEIGAFIAGVLMATHPIAIYVADSLKPLRDFFMVIFFFTLGSSIAHGVGWRNMAFCFDISWHTTDIKTTGFRMVAQPCRRGKNKGERSWVQVGTRQRILTFDHRTGNTIRHCRETCNRFDSNDYADNVYGIALFDYRQIPYSGCGRRPLAPRLA